MSRPQINMKRLNRRFRKITGQGTHGVKLVAKCSALLEYFGQPIPEENAEKVRQASKLLNRSIEKAQRKPLRPSKPIAPKAKKKQPKDFYSSWEWKQARYEVIRSCGQRCQCCGWKPGDTPDGYLVVDHIKPRRVYPELELTVSNLQVLCNDCNMGKGWQFEDDWREIHRATIQ